jgi:tRNA-Thr(GGU) m(6)t(6)A37 methyltransferase TsaA
MDMTLRAIGLVRSPLLDPETAPRFETVSDIPADLVLDPIYVPGLMGLAVGQEIFVFTWLHLAARETLEVHPRGDSSLPLRGVFATRSPSRPNTIGLHRARITAINGNVVTVAAMEAINGTPVIDIKPAEGNLPQENRG